MNTIIKDIHARALIDCKGKPLLEVNVITEDGIMGCGASPENMKLLFSVTVTRTGMTDRASSKR